ncbi:MAG: sugar phosphate isomerase/epimerase [Thermoflexales bacterium]|nr:sugar phosphate isomerase/epimerase [Thermoflexales bacterium]
MRNIGLQLYTVRESAKHDFIGTLRQVSHMGYRGIESYGHFGGLAPREMAAVLDDLGLSLISGHLGLEAFSRGFERLLDDYATLGTRYLGLAWLAPEQRLDAHSYHRIAHTLEKAALMAQKHDITLFHHNHDFEFVRLDGTPALDILLGACDPSLIKAELDVYWAAFAGEDPVATMRRLEGRLPLVHLKDMGPEPARADTVLGAGSLDFDAILQAGDALGVDWYFVEQDHPVGNDLESVGTAMANLKARGWL